MEKISDRIRAAVESKIDGRGRPQTLEALTGISAETWRKFFTGKQRATLMMLEEVCKQWPEYAFWITTGVPDTGHGHQSVDGQPIVYGRAPKSAAAARYFAALLKVSESAPTPEVGKEQALIALADLELLTENGKEISKGFSHLKVLEQLRWIEIFLDNYLLEMEIDTAVSTFNQMRGKAKLLEKPSYEFGEEETLQNLLHKFSAAKNAIEKRVEWMIENNGKN